MGWRFHHQTVYEREHQKEDKDMRRTESILEEYREASFEKRLSLFLECPPLRTRFIEIDQSESGAKNGVRMARCTRTAICLALWSKLAALFPKSVL
jgi:hypothetical protein